MGQRRRYAVRGVSALSAAAMGVGLALPGRWRAPRRSRPRRTPGGASMQERPPLSESQAPDAGRRHRSPPAGRRTPTGRVEALAAAPATPSWVLHGAGWGHGLGMSQFGA